MEENVKSIIQYLNNTKIRCTYGAIADLLNIKPKDVSDYLGERRQEVSWIVSKRSGEPTGYQPKDIHPDLYKNKKIISSAEELSKEMNLQK